MKIKLLVLFFSIISVFSYGQNAPTVYVNVDPPLPICNAGESTSLLADYLQTYATNTNNYDVTSIPYAPQFAFTGGTNLNVAIDDIWSDIVDLPFPFCFYGQNYTKLLVGANGVLTFNIAGVVPGGTENPNVPGDCNWSYSTTIPNASFPIKNAIYGVYQDIDPSLRTNPAIQNINYYVTGTYPNRAFVLNTSEIPQFSCNTSVGLQTYQIILYETTNTIDVLVNKRTPCTGWNGGRGVIGVMNQAGTLAQTPPGRNTGTWSAFNEAWRFTPSSPGGSNVNLTWLENGSPVAVPVNTNPLVVSPTVATTYTAVATYTRCDGTLTVIQDDIVIGPEAPLPTRNPQNIVQCGTPPFNINQNAYMLDTYPASDFAFRYYVDNAGAPGAQIPNATLGAYTPASAVYPQTIWLEVEDQNTTGCVNLRSFTIDLVASPGGTFSYADPYCDSIMAPQAPTLNALTSGGTFSATPAGLIIDPTSGAVTPNGSTPNTYTVSYVVGATALCPSYTAPPVTVTIIASPVTPTINTIAATCSADGSSTITNYNATYTYAFTPAGPTVGAGGVITGMTAGTSYTVTASNGICASAASASFNNPVMLTTPAVPTITATAPTCFSDGSSAIGNHDATLTYTFTPAGPTVGPGGAISGMTVATNYTVTAGNGSCTSASSASFNNPVMLTTPAIPTITTSAATCSADGSSTITNYNAAYTYTFTPPGPTVGAGGVISGMTVATNYTVTAGDGTCTSASSAPFNNPVMLTTPAVPTITTSSATCVADGSSTITNYNAAQTYTFTPAGPTVGAGGVISGMTVATNYTVTAGNGTCTSASSATFNNPAMSATPAVPTINTTPATCSADGSSTVTNYNATQIYTFTPAGPTVGAGGVISGMTAGTNYTVTAGDGTCTSGSSASFNNPVMLTTPAVPTITGVAPTCSADGSSTISNYNAAQTYTFTPAGPSVGAGGLISGMTIGTNYTVTAGNGTCTSASSASFSNAAMLVTPAVPTTNTTPATCAADGATTITNYNAAQTYTFTPAGPTVGAGGVITGMTAGTNYTVTAGNGSCTSASSASFNNPVMLTTPAVPTITSVGPTCSADGSSTISNYNAAQTYTFTPAGPSVGAGGLISGMTIGTSYTVTAGNGSCSSASSASFSNAAMLVTPAVPTISTTPATCAANGASTITNYNAAQTYTFTPAGPTVGAGGVITGMTAGTNYTVTAGNGSCTSASSASFNNPVMLSTPAVPTITSTPPTCTANGSSTVSNFNATQTYTFTPAGPFVGAGGVVTGMTIGTSYTVTAGNGSCSSASSASFSNAAMLVTPAVPTTTTTPATCAANGSSTITNYNAAQTYTFTPAGPTVGAGGVISGMTAGTNYTVTAGNGSCTSASSATFNNPVMLTTPAVPTITSTAPTCTANGSSTISNYSATLTYTFTPVGPSVGAGGVVNGMVIGTSYTVVAGNGSCTSTASATFSNAAMLPTPVLVITNPAAVCSPTTVDLTAPAVTAGSTGGGTLSYWTNATATTALANPNAVAVGGTYYIKSTSGTCSDIEAVTVTIHPIPVITLTGGYICVDAATNAPLSTYTLESGLSPSLYTFVWTDSLGNTVGTQSSYTATAPGTYSVVATTIAAPNCSSASAQATVQPSSSPTDLTFVTSNYFADILSIEVTATPAGNYEYQLDGGQYQTSNVFTGVTPGTHIVSVRDIHNVCSPYSESVEVIDFPRYFTPNGDGIHDTWNIPFLNTQLESKIEIFDRVGKLLKVIRPSGSGWDGTYNGQPLPSTDYWFVVYYEENSLQKVFRSHFAMKR
jgi:gliding motility-associated-like protein